MAKNEWEIESETPIDIGWEIESETPIAKAPETGPSSLPTMTFGEDYGVPDDGDAPVPAQPSPSSGKGGITAAVEALFGKTQRTSVLENYTPDAEDFSANQAQRLEYGAGPIRPEVAAAAAQVKEGKSATTDPTVKRVAKTMAERGDKTIGDLAADAKKPANVQLADQQSASDFRSFGEIARDSLLNLASGVVTVAELPAAIIAPDSRFAADAREAQQFLREQESSTLQANRRLMAERINSEDGFLDQYLATVAELATNPTITIAESIKQVPMFLGILAASRAGSALAGGSVALAEKVSPTIALGEAISGGAIRASASAAGATAGGIGGSMVLAGGDAASATYQRLTDPNQTPKSVWLKNADYQRLIADGLSHDEAVKEIAIEKSRLAAAIAAPLGLLGYAGAEAALVSSMAKRAAGSPLKVFAKELAGESLEEGGTQAAGNLAVRTVDPSQSLMEGVGEAAGMATVTSTPMAGAGAYVAANQTTAQPDSALALDILRQDASITGGEIRPESTSIAAKAAAIQAEQGRLEQLRATVVREQAEREILTPTIESAGSLSAATDAAIAAADQSIKVGTVLTEITNQASQSEQLAATLSALDTAPVVTADTRTEIGAETAAEVSVVSDTGLGVGSNTAIDIARQPEQPVSLTFATAEEAQQEAQRLGVADRMEVADTRQGYVLQPIPAAPTVRDLRDQGRAVAGLKTAIEATGAQAPELAALPGWTVPVSPEGDGSVLRDGADAGLLQRVAEVARTAFGVAPIPVTGLGNLGVAYGGRMYVDLAEIQASAQNGSNPPEALAIATIGHEATHALLEKSTDPLDRDAYTKLRAVVLQYARDGVVEARQQAETAAAGGMEQAGMYGTRAYAEGEVVADVSAAMWVDPKFWQRLYEVDDGSTFRRVLYKFMGAATRFINVAKGSRLDADRFVTNVEAVREAAAQAWATRARGKDAPAEITQPVYSRDTERPNPLLSTVKPEEAAARIRRREGRRPGVGQPGNGRMVFGEGERTLVIGQVTPEDWIAKAQRHLPGQLLEDARRWYQQLHDFLNPIYGNDAERYALAWLLSQQRASPSKGMMDVLRAVDLVNGKPRIVRLVNDEMKELRAGLNEAGLIQALTGIFTGSGVGSKLMDFVDSEMGKTTRTVMRDDPRGRQPAAIDVWAFRDIGFVDKTVLKYIRDTFGEEAAASVKVDASMGEPQYEYGIDFYNDMAEELNRRGFMGGGWTAPQIQAVGWVSTQASMQIQAEFVRDIVGANTRRVSIGLAPGVDTPLSRSLMGQQIPVEVAQRVITDLANRAGVKILSNAAGVGAYMQYVEGSIQLDTFASPEAVRDFMDMLGYAFQQNEIIATRALKSGNRSAVDLFGDDFADAGKAGLWFEAFLRAQGKKVLAPGFQQVKVNGQNGVRLVNFEGRWQGARLEKILDAAKLAADEVGIEISSSEDFNVTLERAQHDWTADQKGSGFLASLSDRGRVQDAQWLASRYFPSRLDLLSYSRAGLAEPAGRSGGEANADQQRGAAQPVARRGDQPAAGRSAGVEVRGAVHYGRAGNLQYLTGSSFGTGIRGAEQERLREATDPRIKKRVYFYLPVGTGIPQAEAGLGQHVYSADLSGLYDVEMQTIRGGGNALETAILDAGYRGYINREQGTVVVLNTDVPVQYKGTADQFQQVRRTPQVAQPRQLTRREGEELVRRPNGDELREIVRLRADITFAAPSFRLQFGEARVAAADAPVADQVLADAGATFQFGEPQFSRNIDSPDMIDDLGAFNLDNLDFETVDMEEPSLRDLVAELEDSGYTVAGRARGADREAQLNFGMVPDREVRSFGLTPEAAFVAPPMTENEYGNFEAFVVAGGSRRRLEVQPFGDAWSSAMAGLRVEAPWGRPLGLRNVSFDIAQNHVQRVAAAIELFARKYDFYKSIPKKSAERLVQFWSAAPNVEGATEFTPGEPEVSGGSLEKLRMVANARLAGSDMRAAVGYEGGHLIIDLITEDGATATGMIELLGRPKGQDRQTVAFHTTLMTKGSGAGKAFYSIANSYAKIMGLKVVADPEGLTAVNSVRRTENGLSSAARTGGEALIEPGWSQRVYGFNPKAKTEAQKQQNLVRLAMAQARNVYELAPEAEGITYNLEAERFERDGVDAEGEISEMLAKPEVRAFSLGRTSFIRAALTSQLVDEEVALPDSVQQPLMYSRRSGPEQYWIGREMTVPEHPAYAQVEDGTLAVMPALKVAGRSFESMPIKALVGDHRTDADARSKNFGLQHLVSNKLLKGRNFVASTGDIAEDAARDIAATALSAIAAYSEGGNRVIFVSSLTKRALVAEVRRDMGPKHYSVVTLMPLSGSEQRKYGAPTLIRSGTVQTPLSGRLSTQGGLDRVPLIAPTTQQGGPTVFLPLTSTQLAQELLKSGATPSRGLATYIITDGGQIGRGPAPAEEAPTEPTNPNWPDKKVFPGLKTGTHEGGGVYRLKDGSARYLDQDGNVVDAPAYSRKDVSPVGFYSALARSIDEAKVSAAPAAGWKDMLKGMLNKGQVKADEVEWTGINDWLDLQQGRVTKQAVMDYLNANGVRVQEVVLGEAQRKIEASQDKLSALFDREGYATFYDDEGYAYNFRDDEGERVDQDDLPFNLRDAVEAHDDLVRKEATDVPKYGAYALPGGENYREVLLTLPTAFERKSVPLEPEIRALGLTADLGDISPRDLMDAGASQDLVDRFNNAMRGSSEGNYYSGHWSAPNVLAHIRTTDRTDADGNRVLFVEEIQSDWGQEGKKKGFIGKPNIVEDGGKFAVEGVNRWYNTREEAAQFFAERNVGLPTAPFVTKTEGWLNLALKRVISMAAEGGYDRVAFVNGQQSANRYDLSKQLDAIEYKRNPDGGGRLLADDKSGRTVVDRAIDSDAQLEDYIGKEAAKKLLTQEPKPNYQSAAMSYVLNDAGLKVGGEGMKTFYDTIVPTALKKLLPKVGGGQMVTVEMAYDPNPDLDSWVAEDGPGDGSRADVSQYRQPGFDVAPAMREKVADGLPMFSRNPAGPGFKLDPESGWLKTKRAMQDYFTRVDQVQKAIAGQGGVVDERNDTYRAEERSYGRIHEAIKDFADKWVKPMVEKAARADVSMDELSLYAYALHAKERNRRIAAINPNMKDGGSGMTNKEADAILKQFASDPRAAAIKDLHSDLMAITATTRRTLLEEGLITDEQYAALDGMYQNYVPLRGFENESDPRIQQLLEERGTRMGTGQGFSIKGNETLRALGRRTRAGDIIENVINDYQRAVVRGEKNAVARTFYQFVLDNPSPNLWEIDAEKTKRSLGIDGYVREKVVLDKDDNTTIAVKLKGNEVFIKVKDPLLARALKKVHNNDMGDQLRTITSGLNVYTSLMRNTLTRFNPEFAIVNLVRDAGFGTMAVLDELGERGVALFWKHYAASNASAHRYEMGRLDPVGNVSDRYFTEYRMAGGTTGGFYMKDADEVRSDIRDMMLLAGASPNNWVEKVKTFGGKAAPYRAAKAAGRVLEHVGAVSENAARVAAFRAAREMGKTPAEAAKIAKNLTTNFNRKGEYGQLLNSLFVFYNAAIQGAERTVKMIKNPKVQKYLAGMVASTMAIALANAWGAGDDEDDGEAYWDKIPAHVKERNLIIMLPPAEELDGAERVGTKGRYVAIPVQYGLNVFTTMGYGLADMLRHYGQDKTRGRGFLDVSASMASVTFGSFNPFGGSVDNAHAAAMMFLPSAADVVYQLANGVNAFGTPVAPFKSELDTKPDSENVNARQAGGPAHAVARWLNSISGGDDTASGAVDVAPGTIENVWGNLTGGTGRFINDVLTLSMNGLEYASGGDPDIFINKIPVFRKVYGEIDGSVDSGLFYDRRRLIQEARQEEKAKAEQGRELLDSEKVALASMASDANRYTKMISAIRREMVEIGKDEEMTAEEKRSQIRALKVERDALTRDFNRMFIETMRAEAAGDFAIPE